MLASEAQFSDFALNFIANPITGDITTVQNEASVKAALTNLIKTEPGERRFDPKWGTALSNFLFAPADIFTETEINDCIADAIKNYEPRVKIIAIETAMIDNGVEITLEYYVLNVPQIQSLDIVVTKT